MSADLDGLPLAKRRKVASFERNHRQSSSTVSHQQFFQTLSDGEHPSVLTTRTPDLHISESQASARHALPQLEFVPGERFDKCVEKNVKRSACRQNTSHACDKEDREDGTEGTVCFGTYDAADVRLISSAYMPEGDIVPISLLNGCVFIAALDSTSQAQPIGQVSCVHSLKILDRLGTHDGLSLELYCCKQHILRHQGHRPKPNAVYLRLLVNIYGSRRLFETIGMFFTRLKLSLRDPLICTRNVPYANPHMLTNEHDEVVMTSSFRLTTEREIFTAPADFLNEILHTDDLPEATSPQAVSTTLLKHQKQALFFMQQKEQGYVIERHTGHSRPYYSGESHGGERPSRVRTDVSQIDSGPVCVVGGLVADQMGLGKTLQMISLIASDLDRIQESNMQGQALTRSPRVADKTTLVIVPVSLLQTWHDQLSEHLKPGTLRWHVLYGTASKRSLILEEVWRFDVVLTTYDTILSEHRKSASSPLYSAITSLSWRRVILDEAHCIRNTNSQRARAVCALDARSRWAVTGTPIQNRLVDLFSILHFLQASPYHDFHTFNETILRPWKTSLNQSAVAIMKGLVRSVAIRRTKASVNLPPRKDEIRRIDFTGSERDYYETVRGRLRYDLNEDGTDSSSVLQWIDTLRCICSRGLEPSPAEQASMFVSNEFEEEEDSLNLNRSDDVHKTNVRGPTELTLSEKSCTAGTESSASITKRGIGELTASSILRSTHPPVDARGLGLDSPVSSDSSTSIDTGTPLFSKVQALVTDVQSHTGKVVVFSFWRSTLAVVFRALRMMQVSSLTLDGSKPIQERNRIIEYFRQNSRIKVLLTTISAGGVGLDLTVANMVCLLEPQWNPTVEEQALSRIHRMNQKQVVTTIRYVMKDSIEENVLDLQRRKATLASLAFESRNKSTSQRVLEDLKLLLS